MPSCTTWIFQPLDVEVFAHFKDVIRKRFHAACLESSNGEVSVPELFAIVSEAIASIIMRRGWAEAFGACGLGHGQQSLKASLRDALGWPALPSFPAVAPDESALRQILPRGSSADPPCCARASFSMVLGSSHARCRCPRRRLQRAKPYEAL